MDAAGGDVGWRWATQNLLPISSKLRCSAASRSAELVGVARGAGDHPDVHASRGLPSRVSIIESRVYI